MMAHDPTPIVHVLCWRLNGATFDERAQQAARVVAALHALRGRVPGLLALQAGPNVVEADDAWDVGAVMHFASRAHLDAYQTDPAHLELKAVVAPLRRARAQLDFEVDPFDPPFKET